MELIHLSVGQELLALIHKVKIELYYNNKSNKYYYNESRHN